MTLHRYLVDSFAGEHSSGGSNAAVRNRGDESLVGESSAMQHLYREIRECAPDNTSVFLVGESGAGKELVARTIHRLSARLNNDFVPLYCSALSPELLESELFGQGNGSRKHAAREHRGYLQRASGGTLFLDEITEMNAGLQARLLHVLEADDSGSLSGTESATDARFIAATRLDPEEAVDRGRLREDLYKRLAQFPIHVPALRQRGDDIIRLAEHFLQERNVETGTAKQFDEAVRDALRSHDWPGNVRELKNAVLHSHLLAGGSIRLEDLPGKVSSAGPGDDDYIRVNVGTPLSEVERRTILSTLEHYGGDKKKAASTLRVSLKTLYNRLKQYDVRQ